MFPEPYFVDEALLDEILASAERKAGGEVEDRYRVGIGQEKDLTLYMYINELKHTHGVLILDEPREYCVSANASGRIDGVISIRYDFCFVTFLYEDMIFTVQPSTYYPFTDENYPGLFNFVAYQRIGRTGKRQASYQNAYTGFVSLRDWIRAWSLRMRAGCLLIKGANEQPICPCVGYDTANLIDRIVKQRGSFRERGVWNDAPILLKSETWNGAHQVIDIIGSTVDLYGHRESFSVDLVTKSICG